MGGSRAGVGAALTLAAVVALGACGGSSSSGGSGSSGGGSATTVTTAPAATTTTTSASDALKAWFTNYGGKSLTALANDGKAIESAGNSSDLTSLGNECQTLLTDVKAAQSDPPIPNDAADQHWQTALSDFRDAANSCVSGVQNQDVAALQRTADLATKGAAELTAAGNALPSGS